MGAARELPIVPVVDAQIAPPEKAAGFVRPAFADDNPVMAAAFMGCVDWASQEPDVLAAFKADTGMSFSPPRSGLEAMIDKATGYHESVALAFVNWVTVNVWGADVGEDGGPNDEQAEPSLMGAPQHDP